MINGLRSDRQGRPTASVSLHGAWCCRKSRDVAWRRCHGAVGRLAAAWPHMALPTPHTQYWLPDDPSGTCQRNELWAVLIFRLLSAHEAAAIIRLAESHAAEHGWSTSRHRNYPTTDLAVTAEITPALHVSLAPLVQTTILPTLAHHYRFELSELSMRDLFVVKYEAAAADAQDRVRRQR